MFILELDSSGNFMKAIAIGSTNYIHSNSIASDNSGNIAICGTFSGSVDFDPDTGLYKVDAGGSNFFFTAKYNLDGKFIWEIKPEFTPYGEGYAVCFDDSGNVYSAGKQTIQPYFAKVNSSGHKIWENFVAANNGGYANQIVCGKKNGIVEACGFKSDQSGSSSYLFHGSLNKYTGELQSGSGLSTFCMNAIACAPDGGFYFCGNVNDVSNNFCVRRTGTFSWNKNIGGPGYEYAKFVESDPSSNVIIVGNYGEPFDADPNSGVYMLGSGSNTFILKLSRLGNFIWAEMLEKPAEVSITNLKTGPSGSIYVIGNYHVNTDSNAVFIARYRNCNYSIYRQPQNTKAAIDSNAQFTIGLSATQATYQWQQKTPAAYVNLVNGINISGANDDTLRINHINSDYINKEYRCIVNDGACSFTSENALLSFGSSGMDKADSYYHFEIYPNPATDELNIILGYLIPDNTEYFIYDLQARLLMREKLTKASLKINLSEIVTGAYFIRIGNHHEKFIKD